MATDIHHNTGFNNNGCNNTGFNNTGFNNTTNSTNNASLMKLNAYITFGEAIYGCQKKIYKNDTINSIDEKKNEESYIECNICNGKGTTQIMMILQNITQYTNKACDNCKGTGHTLSTTYGAYGDFLYIDIPSIIRNEHQCLSLNTENGNNTVYYYNVPPNYNYTYSINPVSTHSSFNLSVVIHIHPDKYWKCINNDLYVMQPVDIVTAWHNHPITIEHLNQYTLLVQPNLPITGNDTYIVQGCGINGGHLYIKFFIVIPTQSLKQQCLTQLNESNTSIPNKPVIIAFQCNIQS